MTIDTADTLGAVLAGGQSRRLGRDKANVELEGRSLLGRALATLREVFDQVVLVSPPRDYGPRVDVDFVHDEVPGLGPLAGIMAALRHAAGSPVFVLACDLPFVSADLIRYLNRSSRIGVATTDLESDVVASIPCLGGRLQPLCGLYGPRCLPYIEGSLGRGELGVREMLMKIPTEFLQLDPSLPFVHEDLFLNINRPGDLRRAEARLARPMDSAL